MALIECPLNLRVIKLRALIDSCNLWWLVKVTLLLLIQDFPDGWEC